MDTHRGYPNSYTLPLVGPQQVAKSYYLIIPRLQRYKDILLLFKYITEAYNHTCCLRLTNSSYKIVLFYFSSPMEIHFSKKNGRTNLFFLQI